MSADDNAERELLRRQRDHYKRALEDLRHAAIMAGHALENYPSGEPECEGCHGGLRGCDPHGPCPHGNMCQRMPCSCKYWRKRKAEDSAPALRRWRWAR